MASNSPVNINQTSNSKDPGSVSMPKGPIIYPARVKKIYLQIEGSNQDWKNYGWIRFIKIGDEYNKDTPIESLQIAQPLYSHFQNFPLENEIVYIISFPSSDSQLSPLSNVNYYIDTISIWNHPHHGALPDTRDEVTKTSTSTYSDTETGNPIVNPSNTTNKVTLGKYFTTYSKNLQPLLSFEGDRIYQGRSGNSIRFSSTQPKANNFWNTGDAQKPILIISNGDEALETDTPVQPRIEDIETDTIVMLCDNQVIDFNLPFTDFKSFNTTITESDVRKPESVPTQVNTPQDISNIPETETVPEPAISVDPPQTPIEESQTPPESEQLIEEDTEFINEERTAQTDTTLNERKVSPSTVGDVQDPKNTNNISGNTLITAEQLSAILGSSPRVPVSSLIGPLNKTLITYNINNNLRISHFLAQVLHESGRFGWFTELATGKAYEGREDLGNTQPGDGVKFKGRGAIQITGRFNYTILTRDFNTDFVNNPTQLANIENAILSAGWYWNKRKLNRYADIDDIRTITKKINGGFNGLQERIAYYTKTKSVLNGSV